MSARATMRAAVEVRFSSGARAGAGRGATKAASRGRCAHGGGWRAARVGARGRVRGKTVGALSGADAVALADAARDAWGIFEISDAGALMDAASALANASGGVDVGDVVASSSGGVDVGAMVDGAALKDAMDAVMADERAAKIASGEIVVPQRMEGWLAPVSDALEDLLFAIQGQLKSMGVPYSTGNAIIILTILVKAVTFPLTKDQVVSSLNMKNLQPQIKLIREKYEDDSERMNVEINRLYEENNVNPLAGCGPLLLTFPVLAGLYRAFNNAGIDGAFDEAWFFLPSLAGPTDARDLSWLLPLDSDFAPPIGWHDASLYLIFPILTTISQFISMEVLKPAEEESTEEMKNQSVLLKLLPFFIGYISLTVPAGLALYWFWNNVFTSSIQVFLRNGGAVATVEAPDNIALKIPLGCVVIPEGAEFLAADEEYTGPSIIWDEEWLAKWQAEQAANAPAEAAQDALAAGMSEEDAKAMEEALRTRLPRKKNIAERNLATETELKSIIKDFKARGEDPETIQVLEQGLVALREYKAELKAKASESEAAAAK